MAGELLSLPRRALSRLWVGDEAAERAGAADNAKGASPPLDEDTSGSEESRTTTGGEGGKDQQQRKEEQKTEGEGPRQQPLQNPPETSRLGSTPGTAPLFSQWNISPASQRVLSVVAFPVQLASSLIGHVGESAGAVGSSLIGLPASLRGSVLPVLALQQQGTAGDIGGSQLSLEGGEAGEFREEYESFVSVLPDLAGGRLFADISEFVSEFGQAASRLSDEGNGELMQKFIENVTELHLASIVEEATAKAARDDGAVDLPQASVLDFVGVGEDLDDVKGRISELLETYLTNELYESVFCATRAHRENDKRLFVVLAGMVQLCAMERCLAR
jgi:hypothetical protein